MGSATERQRYNVTPSLIGWTHVWNDPWTHICKRGPRNSFSQQSKPKINIKTIEIEKVVSPIFG